MNVREIEATENRHGRNKALFIETPTDPYSEVVMCTSYAAHTFLTNDDYEVSQDWESHG